MRRRRNAKPVRDVSSIRFIASPSLTRVEVCNEVNSCNLVWMERNRSVFVCSPPSSSFLLRSITSFYCPCPCASDRSRRISCLTLSTTPVSSLLFFALSFSFYNLQCRSLSKALEDVQSSLDQRTPFPSRWKRNRVDEKNEVERDEQTDLKDLLSRSDPEVAEFLRQFSNNAVCRWNTVLDCCLMKWTFLL